MQYLLDLILNTPSEHYKSFLRIKSELKTEAHRALFHSLLFYQAIQQEDLTVDEVINFFDPLADELGKLNAAILSASKQFIEVVNGDIYLSVMVALLRARKAADPTLDLQRLIKKIGELLDSNAVYNVAYTGTVLEAAAAYLNSESEMKEEVKEEIPDPFAQVAAQIAKVIIKKQETNAEIIVKQQEIADREKIINIKKIRAIVEIYHRVLAPQEVQWLIKLNDDCRECIEALDDFVERQRIFHIVHGIKELQIEAENKKEEKSEKNFMSDFFDKNIGIKNIYVIREIIILLQAHIYNNKGNDAASRLDLFMEKFDPKKENLQKDLIDKVAHCSAEVRKIVIHFLEQVRNVVTKIETDANKNKWAWQKKWSFWKMPVLIVAPAVSNNSAPGQKAAPKP